MSKYCPETQTAYCPGCENRKSTNEFHVTKGRPGNVSGKCKDCSKTSALDYYYKNNGKEKQNKRFKNLSEEALEIKREYNRRYHVENSSEILPKKAAYKKNNPDKVKQYKRTRYAKKQNAKGSYTSTEWEELCNFYGNKCLCCLKINIELTVDHVVPLSKGGSNFITNLQPLCRSCNSSKNTKSTDYRNKS